MILHLLAAAVCACCLFDERIAVSAGEDWPRWRGPRGDGTWRAPPLALPWPASGLPRVWRQPIGGGHAGVVVQGGRVFTTDRQTAPSEVERVLCFDAATGELIWAFAYATAYGKLDYGNGPRAAPTVAHGKVYTLGAVGHVHCLDATTGKPIWSKDMVRDYAARLPEWGFAASPVIVDDCVVIHTGAEPNGCLIAFARDDGREVWRNLSDPAGYATPVLIEHSGHKQLVAWTPENVVGLEPRTGKLFWSVPYKVTYGVSIATPIFQDGIVFVTGYWEGSKAIRLGQQPGDAKLVWEDNRNLRGLMSQPLYRDGLVYSLDKRFGLTCFELKTGKKLWDDGNRMTPAGRNPQATMVWLGDGDRAIVLNSDGDLILARLDLAGYHEQARANIIGPTWAHPAYAGRFAYARSDSELVCVELPIAPAAQVPPQTTHRLADQPPAAGAIKLPDWWNPADPLPAEKTNCVRCHLTAGRELTLPVRDFARSVHDRAMLSCNDCHGGNTEDDATAHEPEHDFIGTKLSAHMAVCADCHVEEAEAFAKGPHFWDLTKRINRDYPVCIDCHGNHDVGKPPEDFRLANVCSDCHQQFEANMPELAALVAENDRLWQTLRRVQAKGRDAADPTPAEFRRELARLRYATARLVHPAVRSTAEQTRGLNNRTRRLREQLETWLHARE